MNILNQQDSSRHRSDCTVKTMNIKVKKRKDLDDRRYRKSVIESKLAEIDAMNQSSKLYLGESIKLDEKVKISTCAKLSHDDIRNRLLSMWNPETTRVNSNDGESVDGTPTVSEEDDDDSKDMKIVPKEEPSIAKVRKAPTRSRSSNSKSRKKPTRSSSESNLALSMNPPQSSDSPSIADMASTAQEAKVESPRQSKSPTRARRKILAAASTVDRSTPNTGDKRMLKHANNQGGNDLDNLGRSEHGTRSTRIPNRSQTQQGKRSQLALSTEQQQRGDKAPVMPKRPMRGRKPATGKTNSAMESMISTTSRQGKTTGTRGSRSRDRSEDLLSQQSEHGTTSTSTAIRPGISSSFHCPDHQERFGAVSRSFQANGKSRVPMDRSFLEGLKKEYYDPTKNKREVSNENGTSSSSSIPSTTPKQVDSGTCHSKLNQLRAHSGLKPLRQSSYLDGLARENALKMAESDGKFTLRTNFQGHILRGESIAATMSPLMAMEEGYEAERNNVLNPSFDEFGVASYRTSNGTIYMCHLFSGHFEIACKDIP